MNYKEFSQKIREKYPGKYDDLDDRALAEKVIARYPQYKDVTFENAGGASLAETAAQAVTPTDPSTKEPFLKRLARATGETLMSPLAPFIPGLRKKVFSPVAGQAGLSGLLEQEGTKVQKAVESASENLPDLPGPDKTLTKAFSGAFRPSDVQQAIGGEVIGTGAGAMVGKTIKLVAALGEKLTGIKAGNFEELFKNPTALFAPTKKTVAKAYTKAETQQIRSTIEDIVKDATTADAAKVRRAGKVLTREAPLSKKKAAEILVEGRKSLDRQISTIESQLQPLQAAGKSTSSAQTAVRAKMGLRKEINKVLDVIAPNLRAADRLAARQAVADPFRRISLPGNIHLFSPRGIARAVPGLPTALGVGTAVSGAAAKVSGLPGVGSTVGRMAGIRGNRRQTPGPQPGLLKAVLSSARNMTGSGTDQKVESLTKRILDRISGVNEPETKEAERKIKDVFARIFGPDAESARAATRSGGRPVGDDLIVKLITLGMDLKEGKLYEDRKKKSLRP